MLFSIAGSIADAAAVNPNDIEAVLANSLSAFFIKGKPAFRNGLKRLPKNPLRCSIVENWVFDDLY